MGLARQRLAADVRRRRSSHLAVVLLLGVTLGISLTAIAGARRTQSAYPRFLRWGHASTLSMTGGSLDDLAVEAAVRRFPEVVRSSSYLAFQTNVMVGGRPDFTQNFEPVGTVDGRYFTQDRFAVTRGREADATRGDEVMVNEYAARQFGYRVGQHLTLATWSPEVVQDPAFYQRPPAPRRVDRVTVVGIGLFSDEVLQDEGDRTTRMLLTPAFTRQIRADAIYSLQGVVLRRGDADVARVKARYEGLVPKGTSTYRVTSTDEFHALGATRPLTIALAAFGVIAGLAGLVLVGQALGRLVRADREERAVLRAVGARPRSIALAMLVTPVATIVLGALVAVVVAIALSPLMPVGPVRRVEVHRGIDVDGAVLVWGPLVAGLVLLVAVLLVVYAELPHRLAARDRRPARPSRVVAFAAGAGARVPAMVGLRFALEPGDPTTAVPVRSVIPSAAVAIVALVASITFGTSLTHLVDRPALYGWTWQVTALDANGYGNYGSARARAVLAADPAVAAWSGAYFGTTLVGGHDTPLLGMAPGSAVVPPILAGRAPTDAHEIALGQQTADELHARIGDRIAVGPSGRPATVVGLATLPTVGIVHGAHPSLGVGALVVPEVVPGFDRDLTNTRTGTYGPNVLFIRLRPGADEAKARHRFERSLAPAADFGGSAILPVQRPAEIVNSSAVGTAPALLAGMLALGAMASLALALGSSARRREHDLALLKALGLTRRQLSATMRWQSTSTIVVSLVVGLPMGLVAGRWAWLVFARHLRVVPRAVVSPSAVVGVALLVLVVANLAALLPAHRAARVVATTRPTE